MTTRTRFSPTDLLVLHRHLAEWRQEKFDPTVGVMGFPAD